MDTQRFSDLYAAHSKKLYSYVLTMTLNKDAAWDIVHTVFTRLWEQKSLPQQQEAIRAWLYTTARNAFLNFARDMNRSLAMRCKYRHTIDLDSEAQQRDQEIWEIVAKAEKEERMIIYLHHKAGYSYKEIAEMHGMNEETVKKKALRGLAKLRERFRTKEGEKDEFDP